MRATASSDEPIDVTTDLTLAFERAADPTGGRPLRRRASREEGYDAHDLVMYAGDAGDARGLLDFYVRVPGVQRPEADARSVWRTLEAGVTLERFLEFRGSTMRMLLELAGGSERIQVGYRVSYEHGQLDEVTTWSRARWLLATERSYVFIDYYSTTIH